MQGSVVRHLGKLGVAGSVVGQMRIRFRLSQPTALFHFRLELTCLLELRLNGARSIREMLEITETSTAYIRRKVKEGSTEFLRIIFGGIRTSPMAFPRFLHRLNSWFSLHQKAFWGAFTR